MASQQQDDVLKRLSRHQFLLINGGGLLITVIILLSSALEVGAIVRDYLAKLQDEVSIDARNLTETLAIATANLRNNVLSVEVALRTQDALDEDMLRRYWSAGAALPVSAGADAHPILVLGMHNQGHFQSAWPYLSLARQISPAGTVAARRNTGDLSAYLLSNDRRFLLVSVSPWPGDVWQRRLSDKRELLMKELSNGVDDALLIRSGETRNDLPNQRWLPPRKSPLTGKMVFPVATSVRNDNDQPFGVLITEVPTSRLVPALPISNFGGACLILDSAGRVMLECQESPPKPQLNTIRKALVEGEGKEIRSQFGGEGVIYGWPLGATGWTLVYTQSWREVMVNISSQALASLATAGVIILITWTLLLLVKTRLLVPAVKQSEQVFESEQLNRTLIETAPVGLGLLDVQTAEPLLQSPEMAVMQERMQQRQFDLQRDFITRFHQHRYPFGTLREDITFDAVNGQSLTLAVSMAPVRYHGRDALVVAFTDISEKKRLERNLLAARDAADRANAAKSAFLATMSHEIRTPLNAILGNLELLAQSAMDFQRDRLDTIRRSSDNLLAIVSDVLDFSKIEAGELSLERIEFDLFEVASRSLAIFEPVARAKGLILCAELGDTPAQPMRGDPTRLAQVLNNLLSNAIKFTERGQIKVRIVVDRVAARACLEVEDSGIGMSDQQLQQVFRPFSQADASISRRYGGTGLGLTLCQRLGSAMGGELSVRSVLGQGTVFQLALPLGEVADTGHLPALSGQSILVLAAMPACQAYLGRVLASWGLQIKTYQHPAQLTADVLAEAAVLVLWGDRSTWHDDDENRLIEEASWVIDCHAAGPADPQVCGRLISTSVFGLKGLAAALLHALRIQSIEPRVKRQLALPSHLRVLVAEDNPVNRRLFEEQLQLLGCTVRVVEDGQQATDCLQQAAFDVLITDLSMPVMDGYALARLAREKWPELPIVAATANVTVQEQEACKAAGITRVLTKPLSLAALERALREVRGLAVEVEAELLGGASPAPQPLLLGDKELPADVRLAFERSSIDSLAALRQAREVRDDKRILHELHSLRGAFAVFAMQSLARQAAELDGLVRERGSASSDAAIEAFCAALEQSLSKPSTPDSLISQLVEYAAAAQDDVTTRKIRQLGEELRQLVFLRSPARR